MRGKGKSLVIPLAIVAGYVLSLPAVAWALYDLKRYPRPIWAGYGSRGIWQKSLMLGFLLGGWPGLLIAIGWRMSLTRTALGPERDDFLAYQRERRQRSGKDAP